MSPNPKPVQPSIPESLPTIAGSDTQAGGQAPTMDQAGGLPSGLCPTDQADAILALNFLAEVKGVLQQSSRVTADHELPPAIGRYRLERSLGRGGFAEVFLAWDDALQRPVALKIPLVTGAPDSEYRLRFEREARAAAMLTHPAIVPVYEYDSVGPLAFIAYRFVEGSDLASWLKKNGGVIESRLAARIILRLAEAMEHAHQRGMVHRDLKPANIMIDNEMNQVDIPFQDRVLVTDFGLVKLFSPDQSRLTQAESTIGTPAYMAPEQIEDSSCATPASDVWSLGVMLLEMLTGDVPFRGKSPLATMQAVQAGRLSVPREVVREVPRDLLAICFRCLQREPQERYASAFDLAADLQRWLTGHPVSARSPSRLSRLRLWSQRNPALAIATVVTVVSLLLGLIGTTWQGRNAIQNMLRYQAEYQRAEKSLTIAQQALADEQAQRQRAQKISQWLGATYRSPDPRLQGREVKVVDVLARAETEIAKQFADDPETRWTLGAEIGKAWVSLGENASAKALLEQIYEERRQAGRLSDDSTVDLLLELSTANNNLTHYQIAWELAEQAGDVAASVHGRDSQEMKKVQLLLADVQANLGHLAEANEMRRAVVEFLRDAGEFELRLTAEKKLASGLVQGRDLATAIPLLERLIPEFQQVFGASSVDTLALKTDYANALHHLGRDRELVELRSEIFVGTEQGLGPNHPQTLIALNNLAIAHSRSGDRDGALARWNDQLARTEITFGRDSPYYFLSMLGPAHTLVQLGRWEDARIRLETGVLGLQRTLGKSHPKTLTYWDDWLEVLEHQGRWSEALEGWQEYQQTVLQRDGGASVTSNFSAIRRASMLIQLEDVSAGVELAEFALRELQQLDCANDERQRRTWFAFATVAQALINIQEYSLAKDWCERCVGSGMEDAQSDARIVAVGLLRSAILAALECRSESQEILRELTPPAGEIPDKEREWIATAIGELHTKSQANPAEWQEVADAIAAWRTWLNDSQ